MGTTEAKPFRGRIVGSLKPKILEKCHAYRYLQETTL